MNYQYKEAFSKLAQNPVEVYEEAVRLLCKIGENILKNPSNQNIRVLQKSNATVYNKILSIAGGQDCLKLLGFEEKDTTFVMKHNISLKHIEDFIKEAQVLKKQLIKKPSTLNHMSTGQGTSKESTSNETPNKSQEVIQKIKLPPLQHTYSNPFLKTIEYCAHSALQYEDKKLQERTRNLIPITVLEENAQKRLRLIQTHIKQNKLNDVDLSIQDMMILELLRWFKEEFFTWVDSPPCEYCGGASVFSHMSTDPKLLVYTDRVELHRCKSCSKFTPFPRFNDLNILLETRRGRCGEWANTFTLCCRSLGWDSRYVIDSGDHVWTEVYSFTQKRWLHCDPCENICDTPLVYESGWNKKISYVIAYSAEEVQDVTWRYSSNHKDVLKRRNACSEKELLEAILKIRNNLQKDLSPARKKYLLNRVLSELVEFLVEKKAKSEEFQGRTSGSEIWRIARGEIQKPIEEAKHVWKIKAEDIFNNSVTIRYSAALNKYEFVSNKVIKEICGWEKGAFEINDIFRKEEKDWKMVYLARKEGAQKGSISWKFNFTDIKLKSITIHLENKIYENGLVSIKVCSDENCVILPKSGSFTTNDFANNQELTLTATLSGGKGDIAWQHAQLFRQSLENPDFNFKITFNF